jgi:hypothetical protein
MAGVTDAALNAEELHFLANAVLGPKILKEGTVTPLDRRNSPTYNYLMRKARRSKQPEKGIFRSYVKSNRGQKIFWWDGADILPFESKETVFHLEYTVGRGHMGDEVLYDFLNRNGIQVDYSKGVRKGGHTKAGVQAVVNVLKEKGDDLRYAWVSELRKHIFRSNTDQPKCFAGLADIVSATSNSTGMVGGMPQSNPLLQHVLATGITIDTIQKTIWTMIRSLNRFAGDGSSCDWVAVGDNVYDLLVDLFFGTSTRTGKADHRARQDVAFAKGEKMGIGLPEDCFDLNGVMFVNEPVFSELDEEDNPTVAWGDQMRFINGEHCFLVPVLETTVAHGKPYNQMLERLSYHGEMALVVDHLRTQGVGVIA